MHSNSSFQSQLQSKLEERKEQGIYRSLILAEDKIDFSSNDYLGFARNKSFLIPQDFMAGSTGSRLISGNSPEAVQAEHILAQFHHAEAALIFNTGYMANVGLLSALAGRNDTFISDEYIHASMIDGVRLSQANKYRFKHNDLQDLEKGLQTAKGNKFVLVESLYSMDGDIAPLKEMAILCTQYGAMLIVDEAHSTGIYGDRGEGLVCQYGLEKEVFACIYTFGKAMGLHGAVVTGSQVLKDYLINFARSFVYSTALPPYAYSHIMEAYQLLSGNARGKLSSVISYFKSKIKDAKLSFIQSDTQIQGLLIGDNHKAKGLSKYLFEKGIYVKAILSPTVPLGTERLRICLHAYNTEEEINLLITEINQYLR